MKIDDGKAALEFHFDSDSNVILVCGDWGVGKSFLIREFLKDKQQDIVDFQYLFISAFNVGSLSDFRANLGMEYLTRFMNSEKASNVASTAMRVMESVPWVNQYIKNVGSNVSAVGYQFLRNTTIWVDDLERCADGKLMAQILGEIFYLSEEKGCKVIIAANTEEIHASDSLRSALEKVCTTQFTFKRSQNELFAIGLGAYSANAMLSNLLIALNCRNLRVLFRIKRAADSLLSKFDKIDEEVQTQILVTIAVAAIAKYGSNTKLNNVQELYSHDFGTSGSTEQGKLLRSLGYYSSDDLDKIIITFVDEGHFDPESFRQLVHENSDQIKRSRAKNDYSELVTSLFSDFGISETKILDLMSSFIEKHRGCLDIYMYDSLIKVLKKIRQVSLIPAILTYLPSEFPLEASDDEESYNKRIGFEKEVNSRIRWFYPEEPRNLFENTVLKVAESNGWTPNEIIVLKSTPPDVIANFLVNKAGDNGVKVIRALLEMGDFAGTSEYQGIAKNAISALELIRAGDNPTAIAICDQFNDRISSLKTKIGM